MPKAPSVLLENEVLPVLEVPSVYQDALDPREARVQPERRGARERKVPWDQLVVTVSKVQLVFLALQVPRGPLERTETRERLVSLARKEAKQTRENRDLLVQEVFKVSSELLVLLVLMVSQDPGVSRVCLARRETKDPEDSLGYLGPLDCRACLVHQERRERMGTSAQWVRLVLQVPEVPRVLAELTVPKALLVEWVLWEVMEKRERVVKPATRDHLESPVVEAPEERQGRRESQDHLELLDLQGPADLEETTAPKATLVP